MKEQFSNYLASIGIKDLFYRRVEEICLLLGNLLDEEILDIFVSDYVQEDGTRIYDNLRLFTARGLIEADRFLTHDEFFFSDTRKCSPIAWELKTRDYDFQQATVKSRMSLRVAFTSDIRCEFKASQENCDFLRSLLVKYFVSNTESE